MKLAAEGLFCTKLEEKLAGFAKAVGIVTSSTGAALQIFCIFWLAEIQV